MAAVQRNGQPGPEASGPGPGDQEAVARLAAEQEPGESAIGADPIREAPAAAESGAVEFAGRPGVADPSAVGPGFDAAHTPGSTEVPLNGPSSPCPAGTDDAAGVPPPESSGDGAAQAATPSDGRPLSGAAVAPPAPSSGHDAWFPAASGAVVPPGQYPAWYPAAPDAPPYAAGPPPYPSGPYPPAGPPYAAGPLPGPSGPYPPAGPYAAGPASASPRRRPSWAAPSPTRTHRWGVGAYLLAEAVFLLVGGIISAYLLFSGAQQTVGLLLLGLAAPTVLAAVTAILITKVRGNGPRTDLGLEWSWRDVGLGLAFGFGGLALTIPAATVFAAIAGEGATSAVGDALGGLRASPLLAVLVLLIVVLIAPMCEEILYRGLLWGGVERLAGRWVAFAVTTVLFALAHFEFTRAPLLLVVAIPIAVARLYTGRLLPSIVAHQVNNLLPGVVLMLGLLGALPMT